MKKMSWNILLIIYLSQLIRACHYSRQIRTSSSQCLFNYIGDVSCNLLQFDNCSFLKNESVFWFFGLFEHTRTLKRKVETNIESCSIQCCLENLTLSSTQKGADQCEAKLYLNKKWEIGFFRRFLQIMILSFFTIAVGIFLLAVAISCFQFCKICFEHLNTRRNNPQPPLLIQMAEI